MSFLSFEKGGTEFVGVVLNNGFKGIVISEPLMPDGPTMRQPLNSMNKTKQGSGIRQHPPTESLLCFSFILSHAISKKITAEHS